MLGYIFNQYQLAAWIGFGEANAQLRFCLELRSVYHALAPWPLVGNSEDRSLVWHRGAVWPCNRSRRCYSVQAPSPAPCALAIQPIYDLPRISCSALTLGVVIA